MNSRSKPAVRYRIVPRRPEAHLFEVSCTVDKPDRAGQCFALPAWIPGSYMVREFAKHIVSLRAECAGKEVGIRKTDKHTWRADAVEGTLSVHYEVYAWDLSVRGAHLDQSHGFFNGTSVFLRVLGRDSDTCQVEMLRPAGARYGQWHVATSLSRAGAPAGGFGMYAASSYDELVDHPVEMGEFTSLSFRACGVPHRMAITGVHEADTARLARDLKRICETQIRFWGEPAPMKEYQLLWALGDGYGGLEHRASTALVARRDDLPRKGGAKVTENYRTFLGLCSHEYFHTWNVKRIKPAAFTPYDLNGENYTTLLWMFEGFTSYYDDLMLRRAGLISRSSYLELLARTITNHLRTPGRERQSVADSSFDAWIKYYRQDENTPNAVVSYYVKGSLVALCLDLFIRARTRGRKSLDDVMRALWRRHGRTGAGLGEQAMLPLAEEVTGVSLKDLFRLAVHSTRELPLEKLLATHGIHMTRRAADSSKDRGGPAAATRATAKVRPWLGVRTRTEGKEIVVTHVLEGGPAQSAGIAAGDAIVSVDGLRAQGGWDTLMNKRRPGQVLDVLAFRRDELREFKVTLQRAPADTCDLAVVEKQGSALLNAWLGGEA